MYIAEYFYGSYNNHSTRRDRKLLLSRKEIRTLERPERNRASLSCLCDSLSTTVGLPNL